MQNSSAFCRAQQARQTMRASESALDNVRSIAMRAAAAWGMEAISAERREDRQTRRVEEDGLLHETAEDRMLSENPDRGFASQA